MKKYTQDEILTKFTQIHNNYYDYSKVVYHNRTTKVTIICPKHDEFEITPHNHLKGSGCPKCRKNKIIDKEIVFEQMRTTHNNFYDYSEANYIDGKTKVKIICPIHGDFMQDPSSHKKGIGCPKCANNIPTQEKFIERLTQVHGDTYDYSEVVYKTSYDKIKIKCRIHGAFYQKPSKHIKGSGCPKCLRKNLTDEERIKEYHEVHNNKYDYSKMVYVNNKTKITIICPIHDEFQQVASSHKKGIGCPKCSNRNRRTNDEAINEFKEVHGDTYNYSEVNYVNSNTKVTIICKIHGAFEQTPSKHKQGNGCPRCTNDGKIIRYDRIELIKELEHNLTLYKADPILLITIIQQAGLTSLIKEGIDIDRLIASNANSPDRRRLVQELVDNIDNITSNNQPFDVLDALSELNLPDVDFDSSNGTDLAPTSSVAREIADFSENEIMYSWDNETIEFIESYFLNKLWNSVINCNDNPYEIISLEGKKLLNNIKEKFLDEYASVVDISIPANYRFEYMPNLMQKLVAYRLSQNKNYGNWSGVGAGKTLSAIFASRYANSKNTLILCNNSTVSGWVKAINSYFSNCSVYAKQLLSDTDIRLYNILDIDNPSIPFGLSNYIVLNYETFQLANSEQFAKNLCELNEFDFIVLDEVQFIKQRDANISSSRRGNIETFLSEARKKSSPYVFAMSATPIINNLVEPIKLIELLTGQEHDELSSAPTINNGIKLYQHLTRHGIRYIPNYDIQINTHIREIEAPQLADELSLIGANNILKMEQTLLETKFGLISDVISKGTIVYSHYIDGLIPKLSEMISSLGFSVGVYTGQDKSGFVPFKNGQVDVLLASSPISTGVDGLQYVCNNLIFMCLPWTHAEYMQIIGRIYRQGSMFSSVDVYIPKVNITLDEGVWSWDNLRHNIVEFKATYTDLVMDGVIPQGKIMNQNKMLEKAVVELREWIQRLEDNGEVISKRKEIDVAFSN